MQCSVYVDRDQIAEFNDEAAALAFIRGHFDDDTIASEVWLEIGRVESAKILQGEQLLQRARSSGHSSRLLA